MAKYSNTIIRLASIGAFCGGVALLATGAALTIMPMIIGGFLVVGFSAFALFATSIRR
jgi:hypothetical protein